MVGATNAVNREFTITKDNIQFSSDSTDTYTMMLDVSLLSEIKDPAYVLLLNTRALTDRRVTCRGTKLLF